MAVSLSQLSSAAAGATTIGNLLLVSPQKTLGYRPQNPYSNDGTPVSTANPPALLFHYEGEQTATLESDITDHYVEDNSAVQDQIALKPVIVTTHGFIGELNDVVPVGLQTLSAIASKLTTISAYTPALSVTALNAYNTAFQLYQTAANLASTAVSTYNNLAGGGGENVLGDNQDDTFDFQTGQVDNDQNKQQVAFQQFYGYWSARTLFTVQTPWAVFEDMAIMRLRAVQDAETRVITDFELSFKQIRSASTLVSTQTNNVSYSGRLQQQGASPTSIGAQTPTSGGPSVGSGLSQIGVV